jgi:hypothetical protein
MKDFRDTLIWVLPGFPVDLRLGRFDCALIYGLLMSKVALAQRVIRAPAPHLIGDLVGQYPWGHADLLLIQPARRLDPLVSIHGGANHDVIVVDDGPLARFRAEADASALTQTGNATKFTVTLMTKISPNQLPTAAARPPGKFDASRNLS